MRALSDYPTITELSNFTEEQQHKIFELSLYAVNTGELYRSKFDGIQRSLYKKYIKGEYVEEQANKAFYNTVSTVLKMYEREFDTKYYLSESEKQALASEIREHYTMDFDLYPNGGLLAV